MEATDQVANKLIQNFSKYAVKRGSVIKSSRQTGGQVAHSIKNIYNSPTADDRLQIEGTIGPIADLKTLKQFGSAGVQLTVVNRGARPAKIARAQFCVQGKGFLAALERGFAEDLKHNPPVGHENERLFVNMFPRAKKQCSDGFVLQRDDVCRFFLPFGPYIGPALKAKQDDVFFRVVYFDGSKEILVRGKEAQDVIRSTVEAYGDWPHKPRRTLNFGIEVTSTELPKLDFGLIGKANPNSLWFGKPGTEPKPPEDIQLEVELGIAGIKNDWTIILTMRKLPKKAMERLKAAFCVVEEAEKAIYVQELARIAAHRGETEAAFVIPVEHRDKAIRVVRTFRPELFWIGIFIDRTELIRISSDKLKQVFEALEQHLNTQDQAKQEKS
ncbi:MAG: hypothetical protein K8R36_00330 [Planctomycetales bacterium]|nr:hypothetical protein [Planctomycetales bacterium]